MQTSYLIKYMMSNKPLKYLLNTRVRKSFGHSLAINLCGMHFGSVEYFKTVEKSQIPY